MTQPQRPSAPPEYVVVGHVCRDLHGDGERPGGTAFFAGVTAMRLGRRVGIVTSFGPDFALPMELADADVVNVSADATTTFNHEHGQSGRVLTLTARASTIRATDIPPPWRSVAVMHLAPVAWEVDHDCAPLRQASMLVATPQGWLRRTTGTGTIVPATDELSRLPLGDVAAMVLSAEDVGGDERLIEAIAARCAIVAVTRGAAGCTLYTHGTKVRVPPWPAHEVDTTGAGDVFAAAFFIRLGETADPVASARFAGCTAAMAVESVGVTAIPTRQQLESRLVEESRV